MTTQTQQPIDPITHLWNKTGGVSSAADTPSYDLVIDNLVPLAKQIIQMEAAAIQSLESLINQNFREVCELLLKTNGHLIIIGVGKSGHIAKKIASTFASTGTPAFYLHAAEAGHGDLGMITHKNAVIAISYSGESSEITQIIPKIKKLNVPLVAMTGNPQSTLGRLADLVLNIHVPKEACPYNLAPTTSTTATLVMGDTLAISLLALRGFTAHDFSMNHPSGSLGRYLLSVCELMRTKQKIAIAKPTDFLDMALIEITKKSLGMAVVLDSDGKLRGIFTDGDLRRTINQGYDLHKTQIKEVMTTNPIEISSDTLASRALYIMNKHQITSLIVTDQQEKMLGLIHLHDLLNAGFSYDEQNI